jgi:hypothetical protein
MLTAANKAGRDITRSRQIEPATLLSELGAKPASGWFSSVANTCESIVGARHARWGLLRPDSRSRVAQ